MELTNEDYYWVTKGLVEIAAECGAPVVSALEGGYNLTYVLLHILIYIMYM
jgi:acetoin utilization deacetylase AcuC-like enzyme